MKNVSMKDHKPYAELKAKHDGLSQRLRALIIPGTPDQLRAKAEAAGLSIEAEAAALLDPKLKVDADKARQTAKELREKAENNEREILILKTALQRLAPDMEKTKHEAALKVAKVVRPEHEKLVPKILDTLRQLNTLMEEEIEICNLLTREIGNYTCITPVSGLSVVGRYGRIVPGREFVPGKSEAQDWDTPLSTILRTLRGKGYSV